MFPALAVIQQKLETLYLIDNRAFHHHHYWVHIPAFWLALAALVLPALHIFKPQWLRPMLAFFVAIAVHLILDSIAGDIKWLWPLSDSFFHLVTIPARHGHWVLNFILHPVFLFEVVIWATALWLLIRSPVKRKTE